MRIASLAVVTIVCSAACADGPTSLQQSPQPDPDSRAALSGTILRQIADYAASHGLTGLIGVQFVGGMHPRVTRLLHSAGKRTLVGVVAEPFASVADGPGVDTPDPVFVVPPLLTGGFLDPLTFKLSQGWGCLDPNGVPVGVTVTVTEWAHDATPNTGGHGTRHGPRPRRAMGAWSVTKGTFPGGLFESTFTPPEAAGDERLRYTVTSLDEPCQGGQTFVDMTYATRLLFLEPLVNGLHGLELSTESFTSDHTSIWYVTHEVGQLVYKTQRDYLAKTGRNIKVTAANLPFGGLQDVEDNWKSPHNRHRCGSEVDMIGRRAASGAPIQSDLEEILETAKSAGFPYCEIEKKNPHVHCSLFNQKSPEGKKPLCPGPAA